MTDTDTPSSGSAEDAAQKMPSAATADSAASDEAAAAAPARTAGSSSPTNDEEDPSKQDGKKDEQKQNFAQRIMALLEQDDVQPYMHWDEDGTAVVLEDSARFAEEVMPRYFAETKYKSFMVRMKRWGFRPITPSYCSKQTHPNKKVLQCDLFRRDKPELCLLMGDERRVHRVNTDVKVAKKKKKAAAAAADAKKKKKKDDAPKKKQEQQSERPVDVTSSEARTNIIAATSARRGGGSGLSTNELALLNYQRNLQNLQTYNLLNGGSRRFSSPCTGTPRNFLEGGVAPPSSSAAAAAAYHRSSLLGSISGGGGLETLRDLHGENDSAGAVANVSLLSIEQDIQYCLEMIAIHQERLSMLQNIKEMKLNFARRASLGGGGGGGVGGRLQMTNH